MTLHLTSHWEKENGHRNHLSMTQSIGWFIWLSLSRLKKLCCSNERLPSLQETIAFFSCLYNMPRTICFGVSNFLTTDSGWRSRHYLEDHQWPWQRTREFWRASNQQLHVLAQEGHVYSSQHYGNTRNHSLLVRTSDGTCQPRWVQEAECYQPPGGRRARNTKN